MDIIVDCEDTTEEGPEYKLLLWQYNQHTAQLQHPVVHAQRPSAISNESYCEYRTEGAYIFPWYSRDIALSNISRSLIIYGEWYKFGNSYLRSFLRTRPPFLLFIFQKQV